jgi:hypothetical protein
MGRDYTGGNAVLATDRARMDTDNLIILNAIKLPGFLFYSGFYPRPSAPSAVKKN